MTTSHETLFIGGGWAPPSSAATIEVRNASTGERVAAVPEGAEGDIDAAVAAARRAFDDPAGWSSWPAPARAAALERLAAELERRTEEIGRLVSIQNGMPIALCSSTPPPWRRATRSCSSPRPRPCSTPTCSPRR
jgi:acyl-CoA reductase-like NAD-dependent aldehyde dehydrogenase